jgi:hypothetical protein
MVHWKMPVQAARSSFDTTAKMILEIWNSSAGAPLFLLEKLKRLILRKRAYDDFPNIEHLFEGIVLAVLIMRVLASGAAFSSHDYANRHSST